MSTFDIAAPRGGRITAAFDIAAPIAGRATLIFEIWHRPEYEIWIHELGGAWISRGVTTSGVPLTVMTAVLADGDYEVVVTRRWGFWQARDPDDLSVRFSVVSNTLITNKPNIIHTVDVLVVLEGVYLLTWDFREMGLTAPTGFEIYLSDTTPVDISGSADATETYIGEGGYSPQVIKAGGGYVAVVPITAAAQATQTEATLPAAVTPSAPADQYAIEG